MLVQGRATALLEKPLTSVSWEVLRMRPPLDDSRHKVKAFHNDNREVDSEVAISGLHIF